MNSNEIYRRIGIGTKSFNLGHYYCQKPSLKVNCASTHIVYFGKVMKAQIGMHAIIKNTVSLHYMVVIELLFSFRLFC